MPMSQPPPVPEQLSRTIETLYRSESGRVLATLVRLLGDLDLAEESMHEAFAAALESWTLAGIPDKPRPWLISTARFKAIDAIRRRARFDGAQRDLSLHLEARINEARIGEAPAENEEIEDDRLRLIFTCCQPDGKVLVTDGPYTETKEHMGGFWILECADMDEAPAWAKKGAIVCDVAGEVRELLFFPAPETAAE